MADSLQPSDEVLMLSWTSGTNRAFDGSAFETYGRHRLRLYRFVLRQLREPALANDLFQEVWQRVIAARGRWTPDAAFTTWLFRIAHNRLADHWRALQYLTTGAGRW